MSMLFTWEQCWVRKRQSIGANLACNTCVFSVDLASVGRCPLYIYVCCGTPIAPLGLKKGLTVFLYTFRTAGAKDENRIRPKYFLSCHIRVSLRSTQRTYTMSSCSTCATITHGQWQHMSDTRTCAAIAQGCREE